MKKLQERLKAGIDFNPKKDPCYDSIVEEAETILGHVLDAAEGKEVPYKNFTVGGGYDERKDREIIIVRGDGEDLLWKLKTNLFVFNLMNVMLSL